MAETKDAPETSLEPSSPSSQSTPASLTPSETPTATPEPSTTTDRTDPESPLKTIHSSPTAAAPSSPAIPAETPADPSERQKLLTQATSFLESGAVRAAPIEAKTSFLKTKGLTDAETRALTQQQSARQKQHVARQPAPAPPPLMQTAPIVTYPEFIAPAPQGPQPLLTGATLVKGLYLGAATAASVYAANALLVMPMLDALTAARMDFAATVSKNLDGLTSRLAELAPKGYVPRQSGQLRVRHTVSDDIDSDDDVDSDTSDPTEVFHVDAQTQTSDFGDGATDDDTLTPDGKLEALGVQMKTLVEAHSDGTDNELNFLLEDLTGYLEGLTYDGVLGSGVYSSPFGGYANQLGSSVGPDGKRIDDPIAKVKQEIRSVKGVLLNTKNFPAGR